MEKRLKEISSDKPTDAIDDEFEGDEVFQVLNMSETLAKKMEEISRKLNRLEVIEEKMRKLDSIEQKMENFSSKLGEMEGSVRALRRELNSSKVAQAELDKTVEDLKESVDFGHGRIDQVELKAFKHDSALKEAKEALERNIFIWRLTAGVKISSSLESPSSKAKVTKIQEVSWWSSYQTSSVLTIPKKLNSNAYIVLERRETALV